MNNKINITTNFVSSKFVDNQSIFHCADKTKMKISGIDNQEQKDAKSADTVLNLSKEGKLKYQNQEKAGVKKKAGITSARELYENMSDELVDSWRGFREGGVINFNEIIRLDEPETYAKLLEADARENGETESEGWSEIYNEWYFRRCFDEDGNWRNPVAGQCAVLDTFDQLYSDEQHDTKFNYYSEDGVNSKTNMWELNSKFTVLLPVDMLNDLATLGNIQEMSEEKYSDIRNNVEKIDEAVKKMKEAERNYEGNLEELQFGVKLWKNGDVTYHANYKGCKEGKNGIIASSAEELLQKLMSE